MDDTLKALKEDMLAFIDPGVAENDIEHTVSVEHHNFLRWFDALDRLSAQQREPVVRVKELEWEDADEGMCTKWRACALGGHYELVALDGDGGGLAVNFYWGRPLSFWFIQGEPDEWGPTGPKMFPTLDAAKSAAKADYEARIKSALVEVPADAGMREALERLLEFSTDELRNTNILMSDPPQSSAAWNIRNAITREIAALTAPGATTKSDGGWPLSRTAGGFPVAAAPSQAEETGVIQSTRQGAGVERGMDQCVTGGESAASNSGPSDHSSPRNPQPRRRAEG